MGNPIVRFGLLALGMLAVSCSSRDDNRVVSRSSNIEVPEPTSNVGTLPGDMDVTASGVFTYRIPIEVPPGRAGIQPSLAVVYSSSQAESSLGVGFEISGFSEITRCPRNYALDDVRRPIQLDDRDALCFDGKRLVPDEDSPAGGHLTQYRTHEDTLQRVTSYADGSLSGITHFVVEAPDGSKRFYGTDRNARQEVEHDGRRVAVTWYLRELRDIHGNTIVYEYDHVTPTPPGDFSDREPLELVQPRRITYTGFFDGSGHTDGTRSVEFRYLDPFIPGTTQIVANPEAKQGWFLGHYFYAQNARRLSTITTAIDDTPVREYRFEGSHDPGSRRWRIDRVVGCTHAPAASADHHGEWVCMPPHVFEWRDPPNLAAERDPVFGVETFLSETFEWPERKKTWTGWCDDGVNWCIEINPVHVLDVNGDGADDLVYLVAETDTRWRLALRLGRYSVKNNLGWPEHRPYATETLTSVVDQFPRRGYRAFDWDFDGRDDIFYVGLDGQAVVLRSTGEDFEVITAGLPRFDVSPFDTPGAPRWQYVDHVTLDINGDGRTDILVCQRDRHSTGDYARDTWHYALRTNTGFTPVTDTGIVTSCYHEELSNQGIPKNTELYSPDKTIGDFDGDGVPELLIMADLWGEDGEAGETFRVLRWNHEHGGVEAIDTNVLASEYLVRPLSVDLNGDGIHDLVGLDQPTGSWMWDPERAHYRAMSLGELGRFANHNPGPPAADSRPLGPVDFGLGAYRIAREIHASYDVPMVHSVLYGIPFELDGDGRGDVLVQTLPAGDTLPHHMGGFELVYEWTPTTVHAVSTVDGVTARHFPTSVRVRGARHVSSGPHPQDLYTPITLTADADGNGTLDLIEYIDVIDDYAPPNPNVRVHLNLRGAPMLVTGVRDGLGARHLIDYSPLSDPDVYTRGTGCRYPVRCASDSRYVVARVRIDNGGLGYRDLYYKYEDGRYDVRGHGWLGFHARTVSDPTSGTVTRTVYDNYTPYDPLLRAYPRAGRPVIEATRTTTTPVSGAPASLRTIAVTKTFDYDVVPGTIGGTYRVNPRRTVTTEYRNMTGPTPGFKVAGKEETRTFDAFGNVIEERVTFDDTDIVTVAHATYVNDTSRWWLGLQQTYSTATYEGECSFDSEVHIDYYPASTKVRAIVEQPTHSTDQVITTIGYDRYGNVTELEATAAGYPSRRDMIIFDPTGYFPEAFVNTLGHTTRVDYSARTGLPLKLTDPNGVVSRWDYDGFGRIRRTAGDGRETWETTYAFATHGTSSMEVTHSSSSGGFRATETDRLGRPIYERWRTPAGLFQRSIRYDTRGNVNAVSTPEQLEPVAVPPAGWTRRIVDELGLLRQFVTPDGDTVDHWYDLRRAYTRDGAGATWTRVYDDVGRLVSVEEPAPGGKVTYQYCGATALRRATDPAGNVTLIDYDRLGRRIALHDPNSGRTQYEYTPFDQLRHLTDNEGRVTSFQYDGLGRITRRQDRDDGTETRFVYDTALTPLGRPVLGALHQAYGPGGAVLDELHYDDLARVSRHIRQVAGMSLHTKLAYDTSGRVSAITYPTTLSAAPLEVVYHYSANGEPERIDANGTTVWRLLESSPHGLPAREALGHGIELTRQFTAAGRIWRLDAVGTVAGATRRPMSVEYAYDARGLVLSRIDHVMGRNETYEYDAVHRLRQVISNDPRYRQEYRYDVLGNLTFAHDVGTLDYRPGTRPAMPHAVKSVAGVSYVYDQTGRLVGRGNDLRIEYNQLNLPRVIRSATSGRTVFEYAADGLRASRESDTRQTIYVPDLYEREHGPQGVRESYFVAGPGGVFLQIDRWQAEAGDVKDEYLYLHRDRLGSVVSVSKPDGTVMLTGYDAFGKVVDTSLPDTVRRGYTGHEHEPADDLINMRGRMYDVRARRFMTPDPFITSLVAQRLNRYSYVLNNPTNFTDPSGYQEAVRTPAETRDPQPASDGSIHMPPIYIFGSPCDDAACERQGAQAAGAVPGQGRRLANPQPTTPAASMWRPSRPLAEGRMTPEQWTEMYERAAPALQAADGVAHAGAYLGGAAAAAAAAPLVAPFVADVGAGLGMGVEGAAVAWRELNLLLLRAMAHSRVVNVAVTGGTSLVYAMSDGNVPLPSTQVVRHVGTAGRAARFVRVFDGELLERTMQYRVDEFLRTHNKMVQPNAATVQYFNPLTNTLETLSRFSSGGTDAEVRCIDEIRRRLGSAFSPTTIRRVYTELAPCQRCQRYLEEFAPNAVIEYTFELFENEARRAYLARSFEYFME